VDHSNLDPIEQLTRLVGWYGVERYLDGRRELDDILGRWHVESGTKKRCRAKSRDISMF
jgi:hypothetical protein